MKVFLLIKWLLIFSILSPVSVNPTYRLINADNLQVQRQGEEHVTYLLGNVHFFYDDIEFFSDRAEIYEKQRYVMLWGNVKAIQDTLVITSGEAQYYHDDQHLRLLRNVVIYEIHDEEISRSVNSINASHFRKHGEFVLTGQVFAQSFADSLYARAGYAYYNQSTGYGYLQQRPLVWRAGADSLSLSAEKIEFFEPIQKLVASFSVVTQNNDIRTTSDFLIFYGEEDRVVYIGNPRFYSEDGDGSADLFTIYLDGNNIREIVMEDNCHIYFKTSPDAPKDSWIISDQMTLTYVDNKPASFVAINNIQSYFRHNQNRRQEMSNNVTGELLTIVFDENSNVTEVNINAAVRGVYRFRRR
jgi:lipopolysaccharide export system protein LptA